MRTTLWVFVGWMACHAPRQDAMEETAAASPVWVPVAAASCGVFAGTSWTFGRYDGVRFDRHGVRRTTTRGRWQPARGQCVGVEGRVAAQFGDERWELAWMGPCAAVLQGQLGQRRELVREQPADCDVPDEAWVGSRWEGARTMTVSPSGEVWWGSETGHWSLDQPDVVRFPAGDVEIVRVGPCALELRRDEAHTGLIRAYPPCDV